MLKQIQLWVFTRSAVALAGSVVPVESVGIATDLSITDGHGLSNGRSPRARSAARRERDEACRVARGQARRHDRPPHLANRLRVAGRGGVAGADPLARRQP